MTDHTVLPVDDPAVLKHVPESGYTLSWSGLSWTVKDKTVLTGLSGIVTPGSVVAILGASGAGKSSLLDILAGRRKPTSGSLMVNGQEGVPMKHVSRYCTQEDALLGSLTVYETLDYAARFNMPSTTTAAERRAHIDRLLAEFGLEDVRDTIVGTPLLKGCSGGQKRRVSVASQIIGNEGGILFLDEPTSGLDSVSSAHLVKSLRDLANDNNSTILATIHQPATDTFNLFTHVLLLGQGRTVFFGAREEAVEFFASIGKPVPTYANPADVFLEWTNVDYDANRDARRQEVQAMAEQFRASPRMMKIERAVHDLRQVAASGGVPAVQAGFTNGVMYQTATLMSRMFLNARKDILAYWVRVAMYVGLAILMGTTWLRMGTYQSTVQDRLAAIFFSVAFLSFMSVAGIPAFLEVRHVFLRERGNGLYSTAAYLLSDFIVSMPFIFIITISFSLIAYWLMGFQGDAGRFFVFVGYLFLALLVAEAQVIFISVAIPIFVAALAITAFLNGLWMVVQGFFVQRMNLPGFWRYSFHYIDFQKYAFEILVKNEFSENMWFQCQRVGAVAPGGSTAANATAAITNAAVQNPACFCIFPSTRSTDGCSFNGLDIIDYYGYGEVNYGAWAGLMIAILVAFKIGTYLILRKHKN
ncbi:hypothetical protein HK105_204808 [Polyrhizophydium stewartii]|uniref:ABC transporter domain-containing protein n=1 Tax=Polyrhizophydium stewartii TaxID=2732419 RepID=A0ABR4N7W6_9FUNG|nr:hypothetical protein HK105_002796 [Polyrhizophydium stewartii]